jgi:hypothetical protein
MSTAKGRKLYYVAVVVPSLDLPYLTRVKSSMRVCSPRTDIHVRTDRLVMCMVALSAERTQPPVTLGL